MTGLSYRIIHVYTLRLLLLVAVKKIRLNLLALLISIKTDNLATTVLTNNKSVVSNDAKTFVRSKHLPKLKLR